MQYKDIKVKKTTVEKLLFSNNDFIVPGYQRPYEWEKEQVELLLNDICEAKEKADDIYLLGTIQLTKNKDNKLEIIDGHQRITTLYLVLIYLNEKPVLSYYNEINGKNSIEELLECEAVYNNNYTVINECLNSKEGEYLEELKNYILKKVIFIEIDIIKQDNSIEDTFKVFNTLNTTGLQLQVKDIFKIKYVEFLKNNCNRNDEYFAKINAAYEQVIHPIDRVDVNEIYELKESDLLDTYRFFLMSKMKGNKAATNFKKSNEAFFEELFQQQDKNGIIDFEEFCNLAECIKKTQCAIEKRDKYFAEIKEKNEPENLLYCYSKELLDWSGYGRIKNLYYYVVFTAYSKNEITEETIRFADSVIDSVWKYCSIFRFIKSSIINEVLNNVGGILFEELITPNSNEEKAQLIKDKLKKDLCEHIKNYGIDYFKPFTSIFTSDGNAFDSNKVHLLMFLSYIHDTIETGNKNIIDTKYNIAYWKYKSIDIEHILSRSLYKGKDVNSLGNLMYLPRKQNRWLGEQLGKKLGKKRFSLKDDFNLKIKTYEKCLDELDSVKAFVNNADYKCTGFIKNRNKRKIDFLKTVYNTVYNFDEIFKNSESECL